MTELKPSFTLPGSVIRPEAQGLGSCVDRNRDQAAGAAALRPGSEEQEWYQHAVRYSGQGLTADEVASACNVSAQTIRNLRKDPRFQERVTRYMAESDRDVMDAFKKELLGATYRLVDLSQNAESEAVKLKATTEIIDRVLGKTLSRTENDSTVRSADPVAEKASLEAEVKGLLGSLGGQRLA